ncbi:MAG: tetratricopeptide repeat protein [Candidatus Hydrogenedens sp.]|jgi:thioredoxin-like negative regulator of GroEL|nr:tetratricopeptide repeat protein [Candidatus Hydrogenedens sp.]
MNSDSAKQRFQQANQLFGERRYEEALTMLQELNREFPNTENIMYAAALCLEKMGSIEEAKLLCHSMLRLFESQKAQELLNQLEMAPRVAGPPSDDPDMEVQVLPKNARLEDIDKEPKSKRNLLIIIIVLILAALVLALPFILNLLKGSGA